MDYYLLDKPVTGIQPRYNAAPGQDLPIIVNQTDKNELKIARFGLLPSWAEDSKVGYKFLNARAETLFEKPTWKNLAQTSRCLIPTNGFYEWQGEKPNRQPYFIHPEEVSLFSLAGLYNSWTNKTSGELIDTFSIITVPANQQMSQIHDRMPVILPRDDIASWLEPSTRSAEILADFLLPYSEKLEIYPVSKEVNSVKNDSPKLIEQIAI